MELIKYEAACRAVAEAKSFDEVKEISSIAEAMRAYARQAKNKDLETDAAEIRFRAERKIGKLIAAQRESGQLHRGGKPSQIPGKKNYPLNAPITLKEIGLEKLHADKCRKLAAVGEKEFEGLIADWRERILVENTRVTLNLLKAGDKAQARADKEIKLANKIVALPDEKFGVIYADPPWKFEVRSDLGLDRSADNHYPTQSTDDICELYVQQVAADDCVLFLWATVPMLPDALRVMAAWGFTYKSHFCWVKDKIGTGYWSRNKHELLLVGTKGREIPAPLMGSQWPSVVEAKVYAHSEKPAAFYDLIEEYYPHLPKLEMNARGPGRKGWKIWGLEAG